MDEYHQIARWETGSAFIRLVRMASEGKAKSFYEDLPRIGVNISPLENPKLFENILQYKNEKADEYFVECGIEQIYINGNQMRCAYYVRYEEFCLYYSSTIDEDMTTEKLIAILNDLDEKMVDLLNLDD